MINPYFIPEDIGKVEYSEYEKKKREKIMEYVQPLLDAAEITSFELNLKNDYIVIEGQKIWVRMSTIGSVYCALINYIWRKTYLLNHPLPENLRAEFDRYNKSMWEKRDK